MAIKYEIKTGKSDSNFKARGQRDAFYIPALKGMKCGLCKKDTLIRFVETGNGYVNAQIDSCCKDFEKRIKEKIQSEK